MLQMELQQQTAANVGAKGGLTATVVPGATAGSTAAEQFKYKKAMCLLQSADVLWGTGLMTAADDTIHYMHVTLTGMCMVAWLWRFDCISVRPLQFGGCTADFTAVTSACLLPRQQHAMIVITNPEARATLFCRALIVSSVVVGVVLCQAVPCTAVVVLQFDPCSNNIWQTMRDVWSV